jgi:hypothetical protein
MVMNLRDSPNVSGLAATKARRDRREKYVVCKVPAEIFSRPAFL